MMRHIRALICLSALALLLAWSGCDETSSLMDSSEPVAPAAGSPGDNLAALDIPADVGMLPGTQIIQSDDAWIREGHHVVSWGEQACVLWQVYERGRKPWEPEILLTNHCGPDSAWHPTNTRLNYEPPGFENYSPSRAELVNYGPMVYAIWVDNRLDPGVGIYFRRSKDMGRSWSPEEVRINGYPASRNGIQRKLIACSEKNVYVAWNDPMYGGSDVFINYSHDQGRTWGEKFIRLSHHEPGEGGEATLIGLVAEGDHVLAMWRDDRRDERTVYFNHSFDAGKTWLPEDGILLYDPSGTRSIGQPSLLRSGDNVSLVWCGDGYERVYCQTSQDGGHTWDASETCLSGDLKDRIGPLHPSIEGDTIIVPWAMATADPAKGQYLLNISEDGGRTWRDKPIDIGPAVDVSAAYYGLRGLYANGYIFLISYSGGITDSKAYLSYSRDGGETWLTQPILLGSSSGTWDPCRLSYSYPYLHTIWEQNNKLVAARGYFP